MAFLSGWADVLSIRRYGCYASMMTGPVINTALAASSQRYGDALFFTSMLMSYISGSCAYRFLEVRRGGKDMPQAISPLILLLFLGNEALTWRHPLSRLPGLLIAVGFGLLNTLSLGVMATITCMLTGHFQRLGKLAVDRAMLCGDSTVDQLEGASRSAKVVCVFSAGIFFSALALSLPAVSTRQLLRGYAPLGAAYFYLLKRTGNTTKHQN